MPHLDANALVSDPDGLDFLKGVLEVSSADLPPLRREIMSQRPGTPWVVSAQEGEINRPRRPAPVPEAA